MFTYNIQTHGRDSLAFNSPQYFVILPQPGHGRDTPSNTVSCDCNLIQHILPSLAGAVLQSIFWHIILDLIATVSTESSSVALYN